MRFKKKKQESLLPPIAPVRFFEMLFTLTPLKKQLISRVHMLRDTLGIEEGEALVYGAVDKNELLFHIAADLSHSGDGVEIFLDTRPGTSAVVGAFCHRFIFDGIFREETHFRTAEESHSPTDSKYLRWEGTEYGITLKVAKKALHGYREGTFGFAMRIQSAGKKQYLGVSAKEGGFENHPELWAKLNVES